MITNDLQRFVSILLYLLQFCLFQTQYYEVLPDYEEAKVEANQLQSLLVECREARIVIASPMHLDSDDKGALFAAANRCDARMRLCEEITIAERTAVDVGDKLGLATLRTEWAGRDLDELRGELNDQKSNCSDVESEIEAAILSEKALHDELMAYLNQNEFNLAVLERESAVTQMHNTLERYLELSIARELITSAMTTFRAEQQDPLLRRASEFFAAITLGEFSGIEADVDEIGNPVVVGRRANGGKTSITAMSDGTRDQLFLSFRLASLENYAKSAEPLPFIADDILVHFDDQRSSSTLDLLAEFGRTNQVLLFTHHRSVRALAEPLAAKGLASIVELGRAS